jgi:hypothetical protein
MSQFWVQIDPETDILRSVQKIAKLCIENFGSSELSSIRVSVNVRLQRRLQPCAASDALARGEGEGAPAEGLRPRALPGACASSRGRRRTRRPERLQPPAAARVRPCRRDTWTGCLDPFFMQERCDQVVLLSFSFFYLAPYVSTWYVPSILFGNDKNGICRGIKKLKRYISNLCFCNGIFPKCESCQWRI